MYKYRIALFFNAHPYCKISYSSADKFEDDSFFLNWLGDWKFK